MAGSSGVAGVRWLWLPNLRGCRIQDTRIPLPVWFRAMWRVSTQKNGASALGLQRVLGLEIRDGLDDAA